MSTERPQSRRAPRPRAGLCNRRPASHRPGAPRLKLRAVIGTALVLAGFVAPVGTDVLPDAIEDIAVETSARAQTTALTPGTPGDCPDQPRQYTALAGGECELVTEACPESPVNNGIIMSESSGFPDAVDLSGNTIHKYHDFCEQRILEKDKLADYTSCTSTPGFVVMTHEIETQVDALGDEITDANGNALIWHMCRLLHPAACAAGLHRVLSNQCRATVRRTWECGPGKIPTNQFNTCYTEPAVYAGQRHPACDLQALDLIAQDCADYVGLDYARAPRTVNCQIDFDTGQSRKTLEPTTRSGSSSDWWCEFETSLLRVECHSANPPTTVCNRSTSVCLKRASATGGCTAIAQTIRCRALQQQYHTGGRIDSSDARLLRSAGCQSCVLLPFQAPPPNCPDEVNSRPNLGRRSGLFDALLLGGQSINFRSGDCRYLANPRYDLHDYPGCLNEPPPDCQGPPQGRIDWQSEHYSQLAIVNSPVIFSITGIPRDIQTTTQLTYDARDSKINVKARDYVRYSDAPHDEPFRLWKPIDSQRTYRRVTHYLPEWAGPCLARGLPRFEVIIEELWPDIPNQKTMIETLFGVASLSWWNSLSAMDQEVRTEGRGFNYWPSLPTQVERDQEVQSRVAERIEIRCNVGDTYWCRWLPSRAGFYVARGGGAWVLREFAQRQNWSVNSWLPGDLTHSTRQGTIKGSVESLGLQGPQVGLNSAVTMLLPSGTDDEWLLTTEATSQYRCPEADLRVTCSGTSDVGNYALTEPVGIRVHEIRVVTRAPNM